MKQIIVVLGLIASTGSLFLLPGKAMAQSGRSPQTETSMAVAKTISASKIKEANYTGTNEDGDREEIDTGKNQAE